MSTLRDYITGTSIRFCNNGTNWGLIEFNGEHGTSGNTGVTLQEAFYKVKHNFYNGEIEYTNDFELAWTKDHDYPKGEDVWGDFYPIIGTAMSLDNQWQSEDPWPGINEVGEQVWWGSTFYPGRSEDPSTGDAIRGRLINYTGSIKVNSTGGYSTESSYGPLYQGRDEFNEFVRYPSAGSQAEREGREGWMATFHQEYAPQYDWLFYRASIGNGNLCIPFQLYNGDPRSNVPYLWNPFYCSNTHYNESNPCYNEIDTNIPVIIWDYAFYQSNASLVNGLMRSYEGDGDLSRFHNYISDGHAVLTNQFVAPNPLDGTKQFNMYCDVYTGAWNPGTGEVSNETFVESRYIQIWVAPIVEGTDTYVSLYKAPEGHELRCNFYVKGDIRQYRYSTDGGNSWSTTTKEGSEELTLPFAYMFYKLSNENRGTYTYDNNHGGNMLLYENEEDAREGNPWKAVDYKDKNQYYPTVNDTGTPELATTMGTTGLRSVFSKKYVVQYSDLVTIANSLFTSGGMIEDLKKGLEMFGNPIEAIQGLMYFPVNLADYFSLVTSSTVIVGGYEITGTNAMLLTRYNGYFDVGSIKILESFPGDDYRNFEPYCNLNIFLPFVGLESLKMNKYVGKTMSIRYYIDATTGECMACLFADGLLTDYFTGQMGVNLPISLHDYAQFAGASMQALAGIAESGANAVLSVPKGDISGVVQGVTGFEGGMYTLKQNSINNFVTTKGTSSSLLNHYLPNYVYVIFEIVETDETSNLLTVEGRRSNASGTIGSFSGFLQVESVNLKASGATESEKRTIKDLLAGGIYI